MFCPLIAQISWKVFTVDEVLGPYVPVFYIAFIVSFLFTPAMRAVAMFYGIIDRPDNARKIHRAPVAYLGGIAVFLGWICGLVISQYLHLHRTEPGWPTDHPIVKFSIVIGGLIIVVLGLWDDIQGVKPAIKILAQIAAAMFLIWDGVGVEATRPLLAPIAVRLGYPDLFPDWFIVLSSSLVVIFLVVGCCNATNLMDGLDGLCGGVTAIIAAGFLFVAVHMAMVGGGVNTNWDALRVILGLALLGAVLGFIPYNFNPASIFMGDTGSMLLGYSCAAMIVMMAQERSKWFLAAMVMFALPVLDTALAFARRYINRRPFFSADKHHFHHQLVARGFSIKQTVMISYGLAIFFGLLGTVMVFLRVRYAIALYLVTFGSIIVAAYKMGMIHERSGGADEAQRGLEGSSNVVATTLSAATVVNVSQTTAKDAAQSEGNPDVAPA